VKRCKRFTPRLPFAKNDAMPSAHLVLLFFLLPFFTVRLSAKIVAFGAGKIIRETANEFPDKFKQPDKIHLNTTGHQELAKQLLPSVIQDLTTS